MASAGSLINATNLLRVGVGPQSEAWHGLVERWLIALPLKFGLICARRPDLSISMQRNVGNRESAAREVKRRCYRRLSVLLGFRLDRTEITTTECLDTPLWASTGRR